MHSPFRQAEGGGHATSPFISTLRGYILRELRLNTPYSGLQLIPTLQFKLTMTTKHSEIPSNSQNQLFVHHNRHLAFSSQQTAMKKVHSLRKVDTYHPTHTPQIHALPFELYPERTKTEISKSQLIERLMENRKERTETLRAEKIKKEESETEGCTFKPAINAESKRLAQREGREEKEAFQRLYESGLSRMKSLHERTSSTNNLEKENCTFHPNIGEKQTNRADLAPIYQRFYQILAEKREAMRVLQQKQKETQLKDRPQVSEKSKEIVQQKYNFKKNVLERLFDHLKDKNNNLQKLAEQKQEKIAKECPFQPSVAYCTNTSIIQGDFLQRQEREAIKLQQKMRSKQENERLTFVPQINKLSNLLVQAEREGETDSARILRLHAEPIVQRRSQIEKIEEEIYRECTFQPEINLISRTLVGQPHSHKCNCHPKEEQYHFKPKINQKSRLMAEKPQTKQKNPMASVQLVRKEQEYKAMKECTFKPKTLGDGYKSAIQKTSLDNIPGAASYKVRVEKVKSKRREEEELKSRLFQLEKRYQQRDHTKIQPFKLSRPQTKIQRLKQQAEEEFRKLHPFRPQVATKLRS